MKNEKTTTTIYTFECNVKTYYIDFTQVNALQYMVSEDETPRASRKTLGEALEYVMIKIGNSDWKIK